MPLASTTLAVLIAAQTISYVSGGGAQQQLDLHIPNAKSFPSVLFAHGGSLTGGDKGDDDYADVCQPFVNAGIACANVNYRLFPDVRWPAPAQDMAAAVQWVKTHIRSFGGDPSRVYLIGHSSGCLLVSLLGTDPTYLATMSLKPSDIAGVIAMGCRLNDRADASNVPPERLKEHFQTDVYDSGFGSVEALNNAVPTAHVAAGMPPYLVLIAESEQFEPPILADAQTFASAARRAGGKVNIQVLKGRKHMTAVRDLGKPNDPTFAQILRFIHSGRW